MKFADLYGFAWFLYCFKLFLMVLGGFEVFLILFSCIFMYFKRAWVPMCPHSSHFPTKFYDIYGFTLFLHGVGLCLMVLNGFERFLTVFHVFSCMLMVLGVRMSETLSDGSPLTSFRASECCVLQVFK